MFHDTLYVDNIPRLWRNWWCIGNLACCWLTGQLDV